MSISAAVCPISNAGCCTTVIGGLNNSSLTIAAGITNHKDDGNPVIDSSSRFISYWDQSDGKVDNGKVGVGLIVPGYKKVVFKNEFGKESQNVVFSSSDKNAPAKFYINSAPAHRKYPTKKVTKKEADIVTLGSLENSNHRTINKLLVASVIETCQLQMGMTELKTGSVWNTMPAHTHDRRMEIYFYFEIPESQSVCHFMGEPDETRHIWMQDEQAVISPNWSIHAGAGTSNYTFIWGMAGENLDYGDMDVCDMNDLK